MKPVKHDPSRDEEPDELPYTKGRIWMNTHPERRDWYERAEDGLRIHASFIPSTIEGGDHRYAISLMGGQFVFYTASCALNLLYMGFISAGAYTLWGVLLKYNPVSRVSILGFVNPVMGVLLSALFLGEGREAFSLTGLLALLLVSAGIVIVNTSEKSIK